MQFMAAAGEAGQAAVAREVDPEAAQAAAALEAGQAVAGQAVATREAPYLLSKIFLDRCASGVKDGHIATRFVARISCAASVLVNAPFR